MRGAKQSLKLFRCFMLNLLKQRQITQRGVETLESCKTFLGRAARWIKRISKPRYVSLQILEARRQNRAKLIVCTEYVPNDLVLAIDRSNALLCDGLKRGKIGVHLGEGCLDFFEFCLREVGIGQLHDEFCRFLELLIKRSALASQFINRAHTEQCGANGKYTLGSLRELQTYDRGRYRSVGDLIHCFANGMERIAADNGGDHGKTADRNE